MNHDEVMWNVMGQGFCSFKVKTRDDKVRFCRNPYNVTGLCSKATCPLSNAQYATITEHEDELYLYVKTAERAHLPRRHWEKIKLDSSFPKALEQIDEELQWWDRRHVNKVKARLLRLKQYLMRKRKMLLEPQAEMVSNNKRQEHKLIRREVKAEKAARIELEIEKELLDRLKKGAYDSVVNYNAEVFDKMLDDEAVEDEEAQEDEDLDMYDFGEEEFDDEEMDEMEDVPVPRQFMMAGEEEDDDEFGNVDDEDIEDFAGPSTAASSRKKATATKGVAASGKKPSGKAGGAAAATAAGGRKTKRTRVTIEREMEQERREQPSAIDEW